MLFLVSAFLFWNHVVQPKIDDIEAGTALSKLYDGFWIPYYVFSENLIVEVKQKREMTVQYKSWPFVSLIFYILVSIYILYGVFLQKVLIDPSLVVTLQVQRERAEREALGALPLYQRTLP